MNVDIAKFSICSLALHAALFSWFGHISPFEHGGTSRDRKTPLTVSVSLLPSDMATTERPLPADTVFSESAPSTEESPASPAAVESPSPPATQDVTASNDYLASGKLTQQPSPLAPIDLNVADVSGIAFSGTVDLTILIDVDGTVVDVIPSTDAEEAREFTERVVERFKSARFRPGEINGRPVQSQVRVTVVSEELPSSAE
ncbi:hypothetical protein GCM10027343_30940 [Noviherbaspirillum agri]